MGNLSNFYSRIIVHATVFIFVSLGFSIHVSAEPVTLVINHQLSAPYTTPEGTGFLDRVLGEAFKIAGLRLRLVKNPAGRALLNANEGIDAGNLNRISGLSRVYKNLIRVEESNMTMDFTSFSRTGNFKITAWKGLRSHNVGFIRGWKIFEKNIPEGTRVTAVKNVQQLFSMLSLGRIDVALYSRWMGIRYVNDMRIKNIRVNSSSLATRKMYTYLHKSYKKYVVKISSALSSLKREGVYENIKQDTLIPEFIGD
jgi:polar amino acid transport system substrate-binding protein